MLVLDSSSHIVWGFKKEKGWGVLREGGGFVRAFMERRIHHNNGNSKTSQVHCAFKFVRATLDLQYRLWILLRKQWGSQVEK